MNLCLHFWVGPDEVRGVVGLYSCYGNPASLLCLAANEIAMTTIEYQIPLYLPDQTCWLECNPYALSQLLIEKLGGQVLDEATLMSFLVANPVWMLLSLSAMGSDPDASRKCKLTDVHQWLIKTDRLTDLRAKQASDSQDSKKVAAKKNAKARKATRRFTKRLALIESADDLKTTLARLVSKTHRKTVMENWARLRIAKSFWKAIRRTAREERNSQAQPQQPDYAAIFTKLNALEKTEAEFDEQLLTRKLDSMRLLAYGASHEINNPLANIATRAQALLLDETDLKRKHRLAVIYEQAMRAHEMISDMMLFAHPPNPNRTTVDLKQVVEGVVGELEPKLSIAKIVCEIKSSMEGGPILFLDATQIAEALKALLVNSIEAIGSVGHINIDIALTKQGAFLSVSDDGPGVDDSISENIFDPFFSGREAGRGLGFGLSKAWRIFQLHGASLRRVKAEQGGASFEVHFPAADSSKFVSQKLFESQESDGPKRSAAENCLDDESPITKRVA